MGWNKLLEHGVADWGGFLFSKGFEMGKDDKTLFLLMQGDDTLIIQV
jgi:hypothetical protein